MSLIVGLLRHGTTEESGLGIAKRKNCLLNAEGRAQAVLSAEVLAGFFDKAGMSASRIHVVSSPLPRAVETAEISRRVLGARDLNLDEAFSEISRGAWEGASWKWIDAQKGPVPGGELRQVALARILAGFRNRLRHHQAHAVVLVGHQITLDGLTSHLGHRRVLHHGEPALFRYEADRWRELPL